MRLNPFAMIRAIAACALVMMIIATASIIAQAQQSSNQNKDAGKTPQISDGERQAAQKVATAADFATALQAATEFNKKYPKSALKTEVTRRVVAKIAQTQDPAQQITQAESYLAAFKEPAEVDVVTPLLIDAYIKAQRVDDAFRVAVPYIERNPSDVAALTQMAIIGVDQAKRQNPKYVPQSQQYALKAIELIESDKKPETMEAAQWNDYKTRWISHLYMSLGLISYLSGNKDDAKTKLDKAVELNSTDPVTYILLGSMVQEEYQQLAQQAKTMLPGALQDETLKKAHAKMDQIIDYYAHAVGLSEGIPQYQPLHDQVLQDLQTFYKYRHNGSTDGLQQMIDKYKKPAQ